MNNWRQQTPLPVDASLAVRFNDLQEHLRRVYDNVVVVQHDIDALVQIYFSANSTDLLFRQQPAYQRDPEVSHHHFESTA